MKRSIALAAALALCLSLFAGCGGSTTGRADSSASSTGASASTSAAEERAPGLYVDGGAVEADPVMTIGTHEVGFDEYRYHYLSILNAYGGRDAELWAGEDGEANREKLKNTVEQNLMAFYAFEDLAAEHDIALTDEEQQAALEAVQGLADQMGGDESFVEVLTQQYFTRDLYTKMLLSNQLEEKVIREVYGDDIRAGVDKDYVHAQHILIKFSETDAAGSDASTSAAEPDHSAELAKAEEVLQKIQAGESFDDLMAEYNEDGGQPAEGYTFTTGQMVQEFEDAAFALEEGAVSEIVETTYGYHILKRLPLDEDYVEENLPNMMNSEVKEKISTALTGVMDGLAITYCDEYDQISPDTLF